MKHRGFDREYREYREGLQLRGVTRRLSLRAIQSGLTPRPDVCSRCKRTVKVEGHHDDYSRPFYLLWLCHKCHGARHSELNRSGGVKNGGMMTLKKAPPEVRARVYAAIRITNLPFVTKGCREWRSRKTLTP